jgi:hypothetical protein
MASLDSLPADQRAVLQLVLQRGRSYEDIARLLSIDRTAVRQRALTAMDTIGPRTRLPEERRAMITDYLLGQLDDQQREQTRNRLAETPGERAWARVIASEIAPLAKEQLPEIPVEANGAGGGTSVAQPGPKAAEDDSGGEAGDYAHAERLGSEEPPAQREPASAVAPPPVGTEPGAAEAPPPPADRGPKVAGMPTSRRGGLILIGGVVAVAIVVLLVVLLSGGSSGKKPSTTAAKTPASSTSASSTTSTTSTTSSTAARVIAQINLTPPTGGSKAAGIAEVLKEGANNGIAIVGQNVPPNATKPPNAYAVWLYNSPTDAHILGFVNPGVGKNGRLSTAGGLPANASHYKQLIVTVETQANPKTPGTIILQGALTGLS